MTANEFTPGITFVVNARDSVCPSYHTLNPQFDDLSGSILFRLRDKILDSLKYFGLYKFASRIGTDPVMMAKAFHRCGEANWGVTAVRDGFLSYRIEAGEVICLEADIIPAKIRVGSSDDASRFLILPAERAYFRSGFLLIALHAVRRGYDEYRGGADNRDKAGEKEAAEGLGLHVLLEEDLLGVQAGMLVK